MSEETAAAAPPGPEESVSPAAYAAFIGQLDLVDIWLQTARVVNHYGPRTPEGASLALESRTNYEAGAEDIEGFEVAQTYVARFERGDVTYAEIEVTFGLLFSSKQPMTETLFKVFSDVNLPVNTWPYFREYIAATLGRMGWTPFTLPALKRGTKPPPRQKRSRSSRAAKPP
jgi:preprotein translocase subunit SecB